MRGDLRIDHGALAPANRRHVDDDGAGHRAELRAVAHLMRDLRTPNLVLGGQAGDVGTGAADPSPLHDRRASPGPRQLPGQELARFSTAEDQDVIPFRLRHARVRVPALSRNPRLEQTASVRKWLRGYCSGPGDIASIFMGSTFAPATWWRSGRSPKALPSG